MKERKKKESILNRVNNYVWRIKSRGENKKR